jgi:hypothetical protein
MKLVFPYAGWSIWFSDEEWVTRFHHPQPNPKDHLVEGNHIDENVDMVGLMNDAFAMAD